MGRYKKSEDRNQISLVLMCFGDMIPVDAKVRAIEVIIEKMNIASLGFQCEKANITQ